MPGIRTRESLVGGLRKKERSLDVCQMPEPHHSLESISEDESPISYRFPTYKTLMKIDSPVLK